MAELFIKARNGEDLRAFAERIARILDLSAIEGRESSNYVGGRYFRAAALAVEVICAAADKGDTNDFEFTVTLGPEAIWVVDESFIESGADLVARKLTIAGDTVMRIENAWSIERARKISYVRKMDADGPSKHEVLTKEG